MTAAQTADLGQSDIFRLIVRYCAPTILAAVINASYNVADRIFVGKFVGEDALAALTVCFSPEMVFLAFAMLIGQGSGTLLSIKLGEKMRGEAEKILGQAYFLFIAFSVLVSTLGIIFAPEILGFFGATEKILPLAVSYYRIILAGLVFEKLSFGITNLIRAEGRPSYALAVMCIGCGVNVLLDFVFICVFGWGVEGAAFATIIGQACGAAYVARFYLKKKGIVRLSLEHVRLHPALARKIIELGSPAFIIQSLASVSMALQIYQAKAYGAEGAVTIIGICMTVGMFLFLPMVGISMGVQPIIGFSWGARDFGRAYSAFLHALALAVAAGVLGWAAVQAFPGSIVSCFLPSESALMEMGGRALRICAAVSPLIGVNIVTGGYFQSTGRPKFSIFLTTLRQLVILVPMLLFLPLAFGLDGLWMSFPVSDFGAFAYSVVVAYFEFKRIKKHSILKLDRA